MEVEVKENQIIMGYTTKENFLERVKEKNVFTEQELIFIDKSVETHQELGDDVVLKLGSINEMETMGILGKFYNVCKENGFFPKWIENVENGIDHI